MSRRNKKSLKSISMKSLMKAFTILFFVFLLIYSSILIKRIDIPVILPVEEIHVIGELKFLNADDIKAKVEANTVGGYFTVDMNLIREVLVREPWIKTVTLRRQWPASLNVTVEERTPIAYWNKDAYISGTGEAFAPAIIDKKLNLPSLSGPQGRHATVWRFMNELYQEMERLDYEIVRLDLDQRRAWQMVIASTSTGLSAEADVEINDSSAADLAQNLNQGLISQKVKHHINVKLGRFDTEKRLHRFVRVLPALIYEYENAELGNGHVADKQAEMQLEAQSEAQSVSSETFAARNKIKTIDMRYPNGFAVEQMSQATSKTHTSSVSFVSLNGGRA